MMLYATSEAEILATPDNNNVVIPKSGVEDGLGIIVTGITSNGFFRVNLGDGNVYYVAGNGLTDWPWNDENPYLMPDDDIPVTENEAETPIADSELTTLGPFSPVGKTATSFKYEYTTPDGGKHYMQVPYIVRGIDIRNGDNDGDGISENHQNTWYEGRIWIASNGVTLFVADGFGINPGHMNVYSVFTDGTEDIRPRSPYADAVSEFTGRAYKTQISAADLPKVVPVSTKQVSINPNYPSFVTYKEAFDPLWQKQNTGSEGGLSQLQPYDSNKDGVMDGIGLLDMLATSNYMWTLDYDAGSGNWILTLKSNYTELQWNSILNSLRLITPDANQVYTEIYNACYTGDSILYQNKDNWSLIGNTYVMGIAEKNSGKILVLIQ